MKSIITKLNLQIQKFNLPNQTIQLDENLADNEVNKFKFNDSIKSFPKPPPLIPKIEVDTKRLAQFHSQPRQTNIVKKKNLFLFEIFSTSFSFSTSLSLLFSLSEIESKKRKIGIESTKRNNL